MNYLNTTQVKLTNDASSVSKCSAVGKNYFEDEFIGEFVEKKKSRASLIHLGYYTRAVILNKLINDFIEFLNLHKFLKFQIISCGSGFDTTYWKLSEANLLNNSVFIEIDFPDVIQRKMLLINRSDKLMSHLDKPSCSYPGVNKMNFNYFLLEADLSDLHLVENLLYKAEIDYNIPTLFVSECVITYMKESDSRNLIKWMASKFQNSGFINYEQIHPDDGFGQVMLKHFEKLQSTLFSVSKYPDCQSHKFRYESVGFKKSFCVSEWDALTWLMSTEEIKRVLTLELFDEFEEFHLKCVHYVVAIAGNGIFSNWINGFELAEKSGASRRNIKPDVLDCDLQLFRHCSCSIGSSNFLFGGCNKKTRSCAVYKYSDLSSINTVNYSDSSSLQLDMVYGSVVSFEMNEKSFVCLYGGRASPNKIWNDGSPVLFEVNDNDLVLKLVIDKENLKPRYRSPMVCLNSNKSEVHCWIFGGRTANLNEHLSDFWELILKCDDGKNITHNWKQHDIKKIWPCDRMSHSFSVCSKRSELFIIGGFSMDSSSVLNDMWKWCCWSESWEKVQLAGNLLPRYGHTSHLKDDTIYLIGGVNTLAGLQPSLAVIDLKNLSVVEYTLWFSIPEPVLLFNHTSALVSEGENAEIHIIGGGGNCFSFGTYLNQLALSVKLNKLENI